MCMCAGASVASYLLQPKATISLGTSGAVFGLFAVSVLCKISFNLKKLIECGILGQFVIKQLLQVGLVSEVATTSLCSRCHPNHPRPHALCEGAHAMMQEAMSMKAGSAVIAGHRVGHVAHLGGALAGVMLVYLLSRLPGVPKH